MPFFAADSRHRAYHLVKNVVNAQMYVSEFRLQDYPVREQDVMHTGRAIRFHDWRIAYDAHADLPNVARFREQADGLCELLREQASFFIRCGFDAFEPSDGSSPDQWMAAAHRFRHVYQRAADGRTPAFAEREA